MTDNKSYDEQLKRIMNHLAILCSNCRMRKSSPRPSNGAEPKEEAERTRAVLRRPSKALEAVNKSLRSLGHTVNPKSWKHRQRNYHNNCRDCGLSVNFTVAGLIWGDALRGPCPKSDWYTVREKESAGQ